MEMRFRHWAGITVVACSLIGVASLPPNPRNQRFAMRQRPTPERAAVIRLERQLSTARYLLEVAERRDLAMAELVAAGPDDSSPLVAADGLPEEVREVLEEKVAEAGRGLPLGNGPVRAVLFARASDDGWGFSSTLHLLPHATDGSTCITLYELRPASIRLLDDGSPAQTVVDHALRPGWRSSGTPLARGPCAFFARFGLPGPHVEAWLEQSQYAVARLADWDRPELPDEATPDPAMDLPRLAGWWSLGTLNAMGCSAGRPDRCRQALFVEAAEDYYGSGRRKAMQAAGWLHGDAYSNLFGPATSYFLSDVVRDVGPERFEEFWTSDLPIEQAFASVVGKDVGEWTAEWIAGTVGEHHFGPGVRFSGVLAVALFAGLGVFAGALVAEKRKVG